jgi:glycosyltransferase involved in cell wall biosynthesis
MKIAFVHLNRYREIGSTDFFELSQAVGALLPGSVDVIVAHDGESHAEHSGSVRLHEIPVSARRVWTRESLRFYRRAAELLCELRPDAVIVTFDRGAALIPLLVRWKLGGAAPMFVHHICSVSFAANSFRYRLGNFFTRTESYAFDVVTTLAPDIADEIYGTGFPRPIHIVPIGVNMDKFTFQPQARQNLQMELPDDEFIFVFVSTLSANKSVDQIVEAFHQADLHGRARLWIAGDGPLKEKIETFIREKGLDHVKLLGRIGYDRVPELLSAADMAVSHMTRESRSYLQPPIKVLEYLATGTPVLASDVPGNRFYLDSCTSAMFYEPSGVDGLTAGFRNALEEREKLAGTRQAARDTASTFEWSRIAGDMIDWLLFARPPADR